jgi:hypothetical protein
MRKCEQTFYSSLLDSWYYVKVEVTESDKHSSLLLFVVINGDIWDNIWETHKGTVLALQQIKDKRRSDW